MAIDMSGESSSSTITSPRISFSHDLHHQSDGPNESQYRDFDDGDFDFCINTSSVDAAAASSTAEDLFLDGKIRSLQLQDKKLVILPTNQFPLIPIPIPPNGNGNGNGISNQEIEQKKHDLDVIKRSNSLHCDHKKSSFWSSLQLLSRSNSTGSVPKAVKENPKSKQVKNTSSNAESSSSAAATRKPPLRKNYVGYYNKGAGNGMRISPVLNVSTPNISKKTANLLGLGTFFGSDQNKDKRIKK